MAMPAQNAGGTVGLAIPPGLESLMGCGGPSPFLDGTPIGASRTSSRSSGNSAGPVSRPSADQPASPTKEELVKEVLEAVKTDIQSKTQEEVGKLWQKGMLAMQSMQQQQIAQTTALQGQLAAVEASHSNLVAENQALRAKLESLVNRLAMLSMPPYGPYGWGPYGYGQRPQTPPTAASTPASSTTTPAAGTPAQPATPTLTPANHQPSTPSTEASESRTHTGTPANSTPSQGAPSSTRLEGGEDFHTPAGSPARGTPSVVDELQNGVGPATPTPQLPRIPQFPDSSGGTGASLGEMPAAQTMAAPGQMPMPAPAFTLTLRRADNVPLGLDVRGDAGDKCLTVAQVKPGGAVEAWNKQCQGDAREVRVGDRIIMVNEKEEAQAMREECRNKHLLKMTVLRGSSDVSSSSTTLRAEADEFVPFVQGARGGAPSLQLSPVAEHSESRSAEAPAAEAEQALQAPPAWPSSEVRHASC
eukprot:gnl/TRDRNA2_/TRDRNA2_72753_c0_seq1.p1 gnl/TRDRNA2_/TRDRNA2_72753_c0~~gnl/TRDRNA2_/TRDRNA2_72753_c0_seq1.p1  ORF type:complete len:474 (-),score=81.33 gnl/TRDRNA2_/TRDRNA2_72753_c0_seq1:159-1580(-)